MCIGIPMQVIEMQGTHALCSSENDEELVDMVLVGEQPTGTWILNFLGAAREVLTEEKALQVKQALLAMNNVMLGDQQIDHLFADLIDREPILPPHLQKNTTTEES